MTKSVSHLLGVLEVAGHYRGKDAERKLQAIQDLKESSINGHDILAVIDDDANTEPITVKHWGYDYRCAKGCDHNPAPYGIKRHFGINLIVNGDWNMMTSPLCFEINPYAQIAITGMVIAYSGQRKELVIYENL